jgi:alkylation response protein AidB-like acyl-CoA dehydrogenase
MRFFASDEHDALRASVARFLRERCGRDQVRRLMDSDEGYDRDVWAQLARQLGLVGLSLPAEYGGADAGFQELVTVLEQTGRALLCAPLLASAVFAGQALLVCADEPARAELLPPLIAGELVATLATALASEAARAGARAQPADSAYPADRGWSVDAELDLVLDGQHAGLLLLVAADPDGSAALFAVDRAATGVECTPRAALDGTRRYATLRLRAAPARRLGPVTAPAARRLELAVELALAAEAIGGAAACLDSSVQYARLRHQFGRPIGSFQAVKHKCADVLTELELARSALHYAAWAFDQDDPGLPVAVGVAAVAAVEAFSRAAAENLQIHGGIGFTWEHDAHLFLKRAAADRLLVDPAGRRARLLADLGA